MNGGMRSVESRFDLYSQSCFRVGCTTASARSSTLASEELDTVGAPSVDPVPDAEPSARSSANAGAELPRCTVCPETEASTLAILGVGIIFLSSASKATSCAHVRLKSSEARRNSVRLLPTVRLSCGSFRGPKKISAATSITSNSLFPSESRIKRNMGFERGLPSRFN